MASQPPARRWTLIASHSTLTLFWESREALKNGMPSKKGRVVLETFILGACASSRVLPWRSPRIPAALTDKLSHGRAHQPERSQARVRRLAATEVLPRVGTREGSRASGTAAEQAAPGKSFPALAAPLFSTPRLVSHCRLWAGHIDLWARANPTQIWTAHVASKKVFAH